MRYIMKKKLFSTILCKLSKNSHQMFIFVSLAKHVLLSFACARDELYVVGVLYKSFYETVC